MLLINGARYEQWTPPSEEAFEDTIKEHVQEIFGENSVYLDLKHRLLGSDIAGIPDAYAITLDPDKLWIVEVELSTHNVFEHIIPQLGKFLAGLKRPATRDKLCNVLFNEIESRSNFKQILSRKGEIFKFVSNLVTKSPEVVVIIDRWVSGLEDIEAALSANITICEFVTFYRKDVGLSAHAHQFEPLYLRTTEGYQGLWHSLLDGVRKRGIPVKYRANERVYQAISIGKAGIHFEWIAYHNALGVELHFERPSAAENKRLLRVFEQQKSEIENKVGEPIVFDPSFHKRWTRLLVRKATAETEVPPRIGDELRCWGIETMAKLYHVCKPLLDNSDI
jgi:hypothetical protein